MYETNPYYNPNELGLKILHTHDFSDGNYCFDFRVVWLHEETRRLYTARDSGCSCPSPFENYNKVDDLEVADFVELIDEAREQQKSDWYSGDDIAEYVSKLRYLKRYYC